MKLRGAFALAACSGMIIAGFQSFARAADVDLPENTAQQASALLAVIHSNDHTDGIQVDSADPCRIDTLSDSDTSAVLASANAFRQLAGVEPFAWLSDDDSLWADAQHSALTSAHADAIADSLDDAATPCTYDAADLGTFGLTASSSDGLNMISDLIDDASNPDSLENRIQLLNPALETSVMGAASTTTTYVTIVTSEDGSDLTGKILAVPQTQLSAIAWPAAGFFPADLLPTNTWSISLPGATDLDDATVQVLEPGQEEFTTVSATVAADMAGSSDSGIYAKTLAFPAPVTSADDAIVNLADDESLDYTVRVDAQGNTYEYVVKIFANSDESVDADTESATESGKVRVARSVSDSDEPSATPSALASETPSVEDSASSVEPSASESTDTESADTESAAAVEDPSADPTTDPVEEDTTASEQPAATVSLSKEIVVEGDTVTLSLTDLVDGTQFQKWQKSTDGTVWEDIDFVRNDTWTFTPALADDGVFYRLQATMDDDSHLDSNAVQLTVEKKLTDVKVDVDTPALKPGDTLTGTLSSDPAVDPSDESAPTAEWHYTLDGTTFVPVDGNGNEVVLAAEDDWTVVTLRATVTTPGGQRVEVLSDPVDVNEDGVPVEVTPTPVTPEQTPTPDAPEPTASQTTTPAPEVVAVPKDTARKLPATGQGIGASLIGLGVIGLICTGAGAVISKRTKA